MKKLADIFAGCGGLSLGMEQAGFHSVFMNDIDPICCKTYKRNIPLDNNKIFIGDIKDLNDQIEEFSEFLTDLDLVCGGPPCQGFSMANRQRIIDDPRNHLYKEYLRFLQYTRPKFFLMENVKGMKNKVNEILEDFQNILGEQYNVAYSILNSKDYGVPQNRERFILIGNRVGIESSKIFDKIKSNKRKAFILSEAILDLPELKPNRTKNNNLLENDEIGFFEKDYTYDKTDFYKFINGEKVIKKIYNHKNRYNNDRDIEIFLRLPQGANSLHPSISDIMPYTKRNNIFKDKYFKLKGDDVCKTITSHMKFDCNMYIHPTQSRGLSPREAARIQTFPDSFIFTGPQNSWYHQVGNAVPVKLAEVIGRSIIEWI